MLSLAIAIVNFLNAFVSCPGTKSIASPTGRSLGGGSLFLLTGVIGSETKDSAGVGEECLAGSESESHRLEKSCDRISFRKLSSAEGCGEE